MDILNHCTSEQLDTSLGKYEKMSLFVIWMKLSSGGKYFVNTTEVDLCFFSNRAMCMKTHLDNVVDHVKKIAVLWRSQASLLQ